MERDVHCGLNCRHLSSQYGKNEECARDGDGGSPMGGPVFSVRDDVCTVDGGGFSDGTKCDAVPCRKARR
jgi:hypothetical protein